LFYFRIKKPWITILILSLVSVCLPVISWRFFYFIPFPDVWLYPFPFWGASQILLFAALPVWYLLIISVLSIFKEISKTKTILFPWNYKTILAATLVVISGIVLVKVKAYDPKTEILLGMDHYIQEEKWEKAIELSKSYPGSNQLIAYYTNLALSKTGQMGDRMFEFPQHGVDGLRLEWKRNEVAPFFGGEIYFHLNYNNEAFRWAFESMEAKGLNPRSLKRLVLTSLVNRHYELASKYLGSLNGSLYYKDWARKYKSYVSDTTLIGRDADLSVRRRHLIKNDFISNSVDYNHGLTELLREHPGNRMAFEYQMAAFLITKDIAKFAAYINRLKDLGYRQIPVCYEEALLFCMTYFKKDLVPEGFTIRPTTLQRKNDYIAQLSKYGSNRELAAASLRSQFGKTYWYYLHFSEQSQQNK